MIRSKVFISYRHVGDAWAADRLYDWINKKFPTFMDLSIRRGDPIPDEIERNLAKARVLIAVIGEGWVSAPGLQRLTDKDDWIRREIVTALKARPEMRIIPLLTDDKINLPAAELLPPEMSEFAGLAWERISHVRWDRDITNLLALIAQELEQPAAVGRPDAEPAPARNLAFLCDRTPQENDLTEAARTAFSTGNLICTLAGHRLEAHAEFVTRLKDQGVFEELFADAAGDRDGIDLRMIPWDRSRACAGRYSDMLQFALRANVMGNRRASDPELLEFLRTVPRPLICLLQVTASDIAKCGSSTAVLIGLREAWQQLMLQLSSKPANMLVLWINVTFDEPAQNIAKEVGVAHLTDLEPVEHAHIDEWLVMEDVRRLVNGRETLLWERVGRKDYYIEPGRLHMQRFADAVRSLDQT